MSAARFADTAFTTNPLQYNFNLKFATVISWIICPDLCPLYGLQITLSQGCPHFGGHYNTLFGGGLLFRVFDLVDTSECGTLKLRESEELL